MRRRHVLLAASMTSLLTACGTKRPPDAAPVQPDVTDSGTPPTTPSASVGPTPSPHASANHTGQPGPSSAAPALAPAGSGPIGVGWTEIHPTYHLDHPPGETRYSFDGNEHHFWVYNTDLSTFPGHDSGPRSELRFNNNYSSGQAQFEADLVGLAKAPYA